jgi:hypothetical protein
MQGGRGHDANVALAPNHRLKTFLNGDADCNVDHNQPIADLFPHCTVFFADIAGFTAWSSTREPAQVFLLLQAVYQAFDVLAKKRRVFKVETIGDSYVAVTGLPEPQSDHAMIMVRFASECLVKLGVITKELEVSLGPETGNLGMRVGLHSGPVTAGVLRGDRARFQLFGDTVNTGKIETTLRTSGSTTYNTQTFSILLSVCIASRMESTGIRNKIQISESTADILTKYGMSHWITPREDAVEAKGKGFLKTFWVNRQEKVDRATNNASVVSDLSGAQNPAQILIANSTKTGRLVDWIVDLLLIHIKKMASLQCSEKIGKTQFCYHLL